MGTYLSDNWIVQDEKKTGYLFDVGGAEEMANILQKLINNKYLRDELVKNAYLYVKQNFNIDHIKHNLAEFIEN